jgi:hypothetical protein
MSGRSIPSEKPSAQRKYAQYPGAEQSQCARLGDGRGRDGGKQPVCLNVNSVGDIKRVGATVHAAGPKIEGPKAARRLAATRIDRDHPEKRPGHRVEGVDLAQHVAEIAHQQVIAELAKTSWGESAVTDGQTFVTVLTPFNKPICPLEMVTSS